MILSEAATLARIEPFWSWNTPICWTGFIIFADAIVYRARGNSWLRSNPREFAALALASIPLWLVFEVFNLYLDNWYYDGLPEDWWPRMFGYAWSFATIWPAIFEGAELVAVIRESRGSGKGVSSLPYLPYLPDLLGLPGLPGLPALLCVAAGALMLAAPFVVAPSVARYMAAPVWLGFIFLLEPINAWLGAERLTRERIINLTWSGLLCGVLWEFWNFWSRSKWHYTVPIMEHLKVFEMPVPGYLGFPAFAFECFTMYVFVRAIFSYSYVGSAFPVPPKPHRGEGGRRTYAGRPIAL
jgi:hypothetical protein